jgi:23S rRNA pseudouridine1911/1915/1917 synthase
VKPGIIAKASLGSPVTDEFPDRTQTHQLQLPIAAAGRRLDQALAQSLPQYSRSRLQAWILAGQVLVDGRQPRPRDKVLGGEQVVVTAHFAASTAVAAEQRPVDVVYRDQALLIVNKPAGLVVHPGAGNLHGTLQNALLALDPKLARVPRAGLVHRLDKDTSGLLSGRSNASIWPWCMAP